MLSLKKRIYLLTDCYITIINLKIIWTDHCGFRWWGIDTNFSTGTMFCYATPKSSSGTVDFFFFSLHNYFLDTFLRSKGNTRVVREHLRAPWLPTQTLSTPTAAGIGFWPNWFILLQMHVLTNLYFSISVLEIFKQSFHVSCCNSSFIVVIIF